MARAIIQGFAEQGGYSISTDGRTSTTLAQRSFPGCTVNVYNAGTLTPATIFSDVGGTPKANPFVASSTDGYWFFWADDGSYDVKFSGGGITTPFSLFNFTVGQSGALNDPGSNGMLARTAANTVTPRTITGVTNETSVTNGNGVAGNPTVGLATFLEFTGKTLNGGTYLSPGIANFGSAQHTHADAAGGGQMSATNVFSSGTVPVARLPVMVGATGGSNGTAGLVPQPLIADAANFLRGDGVWATAGGGGGGTPGGSNTTIQYNNSATFGGVSGATSDGTNITFGTANLRATSPRFTTEIRDSNGNAILTLNAVGTAVNNLQLANAAAGGVPTLTAIGADTNINININPKGTGSIVTTGNVTLSNNAPAITMIDVNDSKQIRILLSGTNWQFINDTAGTTPVNIDMAANGLITLTGNIQMTKDSPAIQMNDSVGGSGNDFIINRNGSTTNIGRTSNTDLSLDNTTGVYTFGQIPVGPASDPSTGNQLGRKTYIDNTSMGLSANWFEPDPSISTTGTEDRPSAFLPDGTSMTVSKWRVNYIQGSHTSGGSITFTLRQRTAAGGFSDLASVTLDNTNNTSNTNYTTSFGPTTLAAGDRLTYYISARSGTISERSVSLGVLGFQKRT